MRKTTASQPRKDRHSLNPKQPGLIGQGTIAQPSATVESALATRFHRTNIGPASIANHKQPNPQ